MKYKTIPNSLYSANRKNIAGNLKSNSVALIFGAHQMPRNGDQFFPYRQNSDFFYLTGIEQEKSALILYPDSPAEEFKEVLVILKPNKELEIWEGHKLTKDEAKDISGITTVKYIEEFDSLLHNLLCTAENIYFNLPELQKFKAEVALRDADMLKKIKNEYPLHNFERLAPIIQEQRLIKSKEEIAIIQEACNITKDAFTRVMQTMKPGIKEYEIEAEIAYEFLKKGATGHAYAPIIAGGRNACFLHYIENDQVINDDDLVLMDFGAEYANYSADLSRTIPANGKFSARQRAMYEATLRVFKFARSLMLPGTTINTYHKEVCKMWEEEHINLGLYSAEDVKNHKGESPLWFNYFMHGTGHFMGLDVHDVGTRDTVLKPGMVLTCEPGLYVEEEGIGIRIENDILITEDGNIDLMKHVPIEADEIEEIMNKDQN
jgi:Xaa-Pro aminopeptidase